MKAETLPSLRGGAWQLRSKKDRAALALYDRHYSRQQVGRGEVGPPGQKLVMVSPEEDALWCSHATDYPMDGLDAWRCSVFRNEGLALSSLLIRLAMEVTAQLWLPRPDGWVTWVDTRKVRSSNPGYCFKQAGWWLDCSYRHRYLIRLRADA